MAIFIELQSGELLNIDEVTVIRKETDKYQKDHYNIVYYGVAEEGTYVDSFDTEEARNRRFDEVKRWIRAR